MCVYLMAHGTVLPGRERIMAEKLREVHAEELDFDFQDVRIIIIIIIITYTRCTSLSLSLSLSLISFSNLSLSSLASLSPICMLCMGVCIHIYRMMPRSRWTLCFPQVSTWTPQVMIRITWIT